MAFETYEESTDDGVVVECFKFTVFGRTQLIRVTTAAREISVNGEIYVPGAIKRSQITKSRERSAEQMKVTLPHYDAATENLAAQYISNAPSGRVTVVVYRGHVSESPMSFTQIFEGFVSSSGYNGDGSVELLLKGQRNIFVKEGPRMKWMRSCNHELYDNNCTLLEASFTESNIAVTAISSSGVDITVGGLANRVSPAYADGVFQGGKLIVGDGQEFRLIVSQVGDVLTVRYPFLQIALGASVDVVQGCAHNVTDCNTKFSNIANYGGAPYTPTFNPFDTDINRF